MHYINLLIKVNTRDRIRTYEYLGMNEVPSPLGYSGIYLKRIFKEKIRKTERKGFAQMQTMETKTSKDYLIAWAGTRTQVSSLWG